MGWLIVYNRLKRAIGIYAIDPLHPGRMPIMASLSTHVLDTAAGIPGAGIKIELFRIDDQRQLLCTHTTNSDGRTDEPLLPDAGIGLYELVFHAGDYFRQAGHALTTPPFVDQVVIRFGIGQESHYHVPLLVSPWSYSTYRGS